MVTMMELSDDEGGHNAKREKNEGPSSCDVLRTPIQCVIIITPRRNIDMTKTANLYARIEPKLKSEAESILVGLGVPVSNAINMFYRQIVIHRGLPFPVQFPLHSLRNVAMMSDEQLDAEVAKGFDDIASGRKRSLEQVKSDFAREFSL